MDGGTERARILIVDPLSGKAVGECTGATGLGECPNAMPGSPLPCAGRDLVAVKSTQLEGWRFHVVECALDECPLSWLPLRDGQ